MPTAAEPRRRGRPPKASFQEPLMPTAKQEPPKRVPGPRGQQALMSVVDEGRPQEHKGIQVIREELRPSPLPQCKAPLKISKLHLADGSLAFACRDCTETGDTLADMMQHRNAVHGSKYGKRRPKITFPADADPMDMVLPRRAVDIPGPDELMEMTVAEMMSLLPSIGAIGAYVEQVERENADMRAELDERHQFFEANKTRLANYEAMEAELVDRRLTMKNTGSYEELKTEVVKLRAWREKMIKRFSAVGFVFTEEEEK